jgi:hypothetical protein
LFFVQGGPLRAFAELGSVGVQLSDESANRTIVSAGHTGKIDALYFAGLPCDSTATNIDWAGQQAVRDTLIDRRTSQSS